MGRGLISNILRKAKLIYALDYARYHIRRYKNRKINRVFKSENPDISLPPDYLIYESFQLNYQKFYTDSIETAMWLTNHLQRHIDLKNKRILDWGCGPGRIVRHLPKVVGNGCQFYGTDQNKESIDWCSNNIKGISFHNNSLDARLPYSDNFFDVIYGISVFTHLSKQMHYDWFCEISRILKTDGIIFLTTQGDNFKIKLTQNELKKYSDNDLVVRGSAPEGHRTFSAFHPKGFMTMLFKNVQVLEHIETKPQNRNHLPQDIWIIQKKQNI